MEFNGSSKKLNSNPLTGYMRQPKIYITLPSKGAYWEKGSIEIPESGELAVYSMTAKDELAFKTPDALMNGQAVVDVIQSCIPSIKNAWKIPNIDLDLILIAIRIASYGTKMEISHTVPNTNIEVEHEVDLQILLEQMMMNTWEEAVSLTDELTCFLKPLTYKHLTMTGIKAYETQRLMEAVNNDDYTEEKKLEIFNQSFNKMADITLDLISDSIIGINTPEDVVTDPRHIKEFIKNAEKDIINKIQKHMNTMKESNGLKPFVIKSPPEHIEAGAPETYEVPIQFDNSNFFDPGS